MNTFDTTKLFYDEYLYKISITCQLAEIFRNKNFSYARQELDKLQFAADKNKQLYTGRGLRVEPISYENFELAKKLLNCLHSATTNYKLRIERPRIDIFSNDKQWLLDLGQDAEEFCSGFWRPNRKYSQILKDNPNTVILKNDNGCQFRVTLSYQNNTNWSDWVLNNPDKVKIGPVLEKNLKDKKYGNTVGLYMYVRDEKILQIISLLGVEVRRIDKIVVK